MQEREFELRFLETIPEILLPKISALNGVDHGEQLLQELIFFDKAGEWEKNGDKRGRIRRENSKTTLSFKHWFKGADIEVKEIELEVNDWKKAVALIDSLGFRIAREQEKKRRHFTVLNCSLDFDTWPLIPTLLEVEGESEPAVRRAITELGLRYEDALLLDPKGIYEKHYNIPITKITKLTFNEIIYQ